MKKSTVVSRQSSAVAPLALALALVATPASAQRPVTGWDSTAGALALPVPGRPAVLAITNATILTATKGTIAKGTIVVRNGKIAAVGADVAVPAGAQVIDAAGKYVTPGIIDAHSHSLSEAINEGTLSAGRA